MEIMPENTLALVKYCRANRKDEDISLNNSWDDLMFLISFGDIPNQKYL